MTPPDATPLDDLVAAVCHGTATEEQMRDLGQRLAGDPESRAAYLRQVDLHATLAADDSVFGLSGNSADDGGGVRLPLPVPGEGPPSTRPRRLPSPTLLVAAALAIVTIVALLLRPGISPDTRTPSTADSAIDDDEESGAPASLATLTRSLNARWRGSEPPSDIADPRLLELASGFVQIECGAGALLVAEGPFKAELLSDSALRLEHGKIRVAVPPQASGFTLYTPSLKIIDLGTDFAVLLEADGPGEVHVFEGDVQIVPEGGGRHQNERLSAGQARSFDPLRTGHRLSPRPVNPSAFLGIREIDERARSLRVRQQSAWQASLATLSDDPALRVLFTFADHESWERTVRNLAPNGGDTTGGALVGCQWTRGRWPEKGALDFHRPADRVRLHVKASVDAFTLMAWIHLPSDPPLRPRTLFSALPGGDSDARAPEWQLTLDGGMLLNLRRNPEDKSLVFRQTGLLSPDSPPGWTHVAATAARDSASGRVTVRFHVNGLAPFEKTRKDAFGFAFGRCDIGNALPPPREGATAEIRRKAARRGTLPFIGLIDEFVLLERALSVAEIEAHWRAGAQIPVAE